MDITSHAKNASAATADLVHPGSSTAELTWSEHARTPISAPPALSWYENQAQGRSAQRLLTMVDPDRPPIQTSDTMSHPRPEEAKNPRETAAQSSGPRDPLREAGRDIQWSRRTWRRTPVGVDGLRPAARRDPVWAPYLLCAMGLLSVVFLMPLTEHEEEEVDEASRSFKHSKARTAFLVAVIGVATTGVAAIVVPITQSYINRPPVKTNSEEVLKALKENSEQQAKELKQLREDFIDLRSWTKGYLMAEGFRIMDPPDSNLPPVPEVEIHPRPVHPRRTAFSPAPVVETPLPFPKALGSSKQIPYPIAPAAGD